jgi:hypothetical protein
MELNDLQHCVSRINYGDGSHGNEVFSFCESVRRREDVSKGCAIMVNTFREGNHKIDRLRPIRIVRDS